MGVTRGPVLKAFASVVTVAPAAILFTVTPRRTRARLAFADIAFLIIIILPPRSLALLLLCQPQTAAPPPVILLFKIQQERERDVFKIQQERERDVFKIQQEFRAKRERDGGGGGLFVG